MAGDSTPWLDVEEAESGMVRPHTADGRGSLSSADWKWMPGVLP